MTLVINFNDFNYSIRFFEAVILPHNIIPMLS